ncbi:hypothetical protein FB45DRAFT_859751 [Roridomyces roridus]|uniref:Uncharacterized protein n=1 Tax=Roridomyces roridus TaxID=1738132 RepID=A0AAD7CKH0_9AGAR|nr:hypothetical protein FB45DRAFT_859751 [Roridomyces roridus]
MVVSRGAVTTRHDPSTAGNGYPVSQGTGPGPGRQNCGFRGLYGRAGTRRDGSLTRHFDGRVGALGISAHTWRELLQGLEELRGGELAGGQYYMGVSIMGMALVGPLRIPQENFWALGSSDTDPDRKFLISNSSSIRAAAATVWVLALITLSHSSLQRAPIGKTIHERSILSGTSDLNGWVVVARAKICLITSCLKRRVPDKSCLPSALSTFKNCRMVTTLDTVQKRVKDNESLLDIEEDGVDD